MKTNLLIAALLITVATLSLTAQETTPSKEPAAEKAPACANCNQSVAAQSTTPQEVNLKSITFPQALHGGYHCYGITITFNNFRHEPKATLSKDTAPTYQHKPRKTLGEFQLKEVRDTHDGTHRKAGTIYEPYGHLTDADTGVHCHFPQVATGSSHQDPHAHGHPSYTTLIFSENTPSKCTIVKRFDKQGKPITTINCKQVIIDVAANDGSELSHTLETTQEATTQQNKR
jgi:hypothetical protein